MRRLQLPLDSVISHVVVYFIHSQIQGVGGRVKTENLFQRLKNYLESVCTTPVVQCSWKMGCGCLTSCKEAIY